MHEQALIIFVKNPEKGQVKTRLAADVGDERALQIYRELLRHTREVVTQVPALRLLFYAQYIPQADEWPLSSFEKHLQPSGDLGERMQAAFSQALSRVNKAVIVGSDCATLTPRIVIEAFAKLAQHDVVIGPALDGGYYLLGMKTVHPTLFENMVWSTPSVFAETVQRMQQAGLSWAELPRLSDIDYKEDWDRYGWPIEE